jgi:hypothetical protein
LNRLHLAHRAPLKSLAGVVGDVCGVQAQLMSAAELSLWARVKDLTREDIAEALWRERTLVKAWCMRGASHLLVSADLPIYVAGLLRHSLPREREWFKRYGVTEHEIDEMVRAVIEALGGEILTRKELSKRVVKRVGNKAKRWVEHSWGGIVKQACLQGLVVFGPNQGREITFVRRDKWLPRTTDLPVEEAEARLLRRYLHGYGPATLTDFAAWAGIKSSGAAHIRERVGDDILQVKVEEKACLALREDLIDLQNTAALDAEQNGVRLLPSFDCYMLGHKDKSQIVDQAHYKLVYRKAGWLSPVLLIEGRAKGTWNSSKKGNRLQITIQPFDRIPKDARKQVEEEAADLARFYDTACWLTFSRAS